MPNPYHLVSAAIVSKAELRTFIRDQGGRLDPERIYDGYIQVSNPSLVAIVWDTAREAENLRGMDDYLDTELGRQQKQEELEIQEIMTRKLGAPPGTYVLLDVYKNRPSERLALRFIKAFDARWAPCVLKNFLPAGKAESGQNVWAIDELLAYSGSHGGLPQ